MSYHAIYPEDDGSLVHISCLINYANGQWWAGHSATRWSQQDYWGKQKQPRMSTATKGMTNVIDHPIKRWVETPHARQWPHSVPPVTCDTMNIIVYHLVYNWIDHPVKRQQGLVLPSKTFTKKIIHLYLGSIIPEIRLFCWGTPILSFLRDEDPTRKEWHMMNLQCICDN